MNHQKLDSGTNQEWIKNSGKLFYDPFRKDLKKLHKSRYLICQPKSDDLAKLYTWFLERKYGQNGSIQLPLFYCHISIVDPREHIPNKGLWKKYQNEIIDFEYSVNMNKYWKFWYLPVKSRRANEIRVELGLKQRNDLHITIGREQDWQNLDTH